MRRTPLLWLAVLAVVLCHAAIAVASDAPNAANAASITPVPVPTKAGRSATLSHPSTIRMPMKRSSSYHKASARAKAGSESYKRFLGAMAHGAMLQAREHEMHTMTTTPSSSPLTGCPFTDFTIPVEVGDTWFELIADTGSSTLAVAGSTCSCNSVSPTWTESSYSVDEDTTCTSTYGDGSTWTGEIWNDRVAFGDSDDAAVTASTQANVAVITSQTDFFSTGNCYTASSATITTSIQGIVGLAYEDLAVSNSAGTVSTDSFLVNLFAANTNLTQSFAIQMCADSGQLWVGGVDTSTYSAALQYTPVVNTGSKKLYYTVEPYDIYIGGVSLGFTDSNWGTVSIVDSGTTLWELPSTVYSSVVSTIISDTSFQKYFRHATNANFFGDSSGYCETTTVSVTYQTLQEVLPTITITMVNGLQLTMDGVGSYLLPCTPAYNQWTPGISSSGSTQMIGGWPMMNQFIVEFDIENSQVGFSVGSSCSVTPLNANVTVGESSPGSDGGIGAAHQTAPTGLVLATTLLAAVWAILNA